MKVVVYLFALASLAYGQMSTSSILGHVEDATGGALAGVAITAQQESTGFKRMTLSDNSGSYRMDQLSPGTYTVRAERPGFGAELASHLVIEVNQQATFDFRLQLGESRDSVSVTASVSPLETADSSVGYRVDSGTFAQLPVDGRNIASLMTIGPGAVPRHLGGFVHDADNDVQQGTRGSVALNPAVNGGRPSMNSFLLDGAYNTDRNAFAVVISPPMDGVQEFRVQSSLAPAFSMNAGGGVVDMVTKSGSKDLHGSAFEYFRNEITDARNYFDDPSLARPISRRNQFGGSLGGSLPLPSTFFFGAYEGVRGKSAVPSVQLVPDAQLRTGNFQGGNTIFDPRGASSAAERTPFPGNVIPAGAIDAVAANYLNQFEPLPNRSGSAAGNYLDTTPSTNTNDAVSIRIDHQLHGGGLLFGRYTLNDERGGIGGNFPLRPTSEKLRAQQAVIGHTMAGSFWSNEIRTSFTRLRLFDVPLSANRENVAAGLGIANPPTDPFAFGLPYFFLSDFSTVTDDPTLPQIQRDNTTAVSETLSLMRGRRSYKFGFNWIHFQYNYRQTNNLRGQYVYSGAFTGNGSDPASGDALADFLLGFPQSTERRTGDSQAYLRQNAFGAFAQQDWQASRRLSLTLGVRYEYSSPFSEDRGKLLNLDYSSLPNQPSLVNVARSSNANRFNFAPRASLAWRLPGLFSTTGDTVFRAGYGMYYSPEMGVESYYLVLNGLRNELNSSDGLAAPILTTRDGFPSGASTGLPSYYGLDKRLPTPYVQQWNAGIQRELPGNVVFEAAYVGSKGTDLGRFRRFNTALHTETGENLDPRPGDLQSLRPFPDLGTLFQFQHIANSAYNSLQFKAEKRYRSSLSLLASFVWSKSIDDSSSVIPSLFDSGGAQDERNLRLERGLSVFNVGRRFSGTVVYDLPGSKRFRSVFGGWQLASVITLQDGTPLDPLYMSNDTANAGTFTRPNIVPGQRISLPSSERTPERWFNTAAFSAPAPYTFGNAGRDIIPGPGNAVIDLSLHKRFPISERARLEFRAEGFNIFNHPNFGFPDPYPDQGPFFGRILTTGQPRRLQFATRLDF